MKLYLESTDLRLPKQEITCFQVLDPEELSDRTSIQEPRGKVLYYSGDGSSPSGVITFGPEEDIRQYVISPEDVLLLARQESIALGVTQPGGMSREKIFASLKMKLVEGTAQSYRQKFFDAETGEELCALKRKDTVWRATPDQMDETERTEFSVLLAVALGHTDLYVVECIADSTCFFSENYLYPNAPEFIQEPSGVSAGVSSTTQSLSQNRRSIAHATWGIELEMTVPRQEAHWTSSVFDFHGDGSIHPGEEGYMGLEIVTKGGSDYQKLLQKIHTVCTWSQEHKAKVNTSCGYHVHMKHPLLQEKKYLSRILFLWSAMEDVLFSTQPSSRLENHYAASILRPYVETYTNLPEGKRQLVQFCGSRDRYRTLNIASMGEHGTVEVRLHAGTLNEEKIVQWVTFLQQFFAYAFSPHYHSKDVRTLFLEEISNTKVDHAFAMLELPEPTRKHFKKRIAKFGWKKLVEERKKSVEGLMIEKEIQKMKKSLSTMTAKLEAFQQKRNVLWGGTH